jgi:hypothetical protein
VRLPRPLLGAALGALLVALAAIAPHAAQARPDGDAVRPFRLGLSNSFWLGFSGEISNPVPAYAVALDLGFPTGRRMRYHVEVGYQSLNGHDGLRFSPLTLGYGIPIPDVARGLRLEVEVLLDIVRAEVLFDDKYVVSLSSGLRAQVVASYGVGFLAFAPLGFELRYAYGIEDTGIRTGVGANWPFHLTLGVEL